MGPIASLKTLCLILLVTILASPSLCRADGTPNPGTIISVFTPGDHLESYILRALQLAKRSVHVAIYSITQPELIRALIEAKRRAVEVLVITDAGQSRQPYSGISQLVAGEVPVLIATHYQAMHHKFAVIDGARTIVGSYNWTRAAETHNAEDLNIIDGTGTAAEYEAAFRHLRSVSVPILSATRPHSAASG